ncbi:Rho GTPase-activating protein [Friedmanniomyces endolithicus]|nr:Rho GTPase-activating protein [Friedmanniomyces endolithicus]
MSHEFDRNDMDGDSPSAANGSAEPVSPSSPIVDSSPVHEPAGHSNGISAATKETPKQVEDVMYSDIGINTLLNRLKQSIASARDFASFLQKRSKLEEEQAGGLKRLASLHIIESQRKTEMRGGSYATQVGEVMRVHERIAENGMQFALSLHQMHEDLNVLTANMERGRKAAKHEGLEAEKRASDAEAAMQKAKSKYEHLAEDYDRAKTGDTKGSRRMGLKGPKSQEQYESDLQRKVQAADADYEERVRMARTQREQLVSQLRPKMVRQLRELCRECDAGVTLQLQKFATFNEKLLLGNGVIVSPLNGEHGAQRSLRDVVAEIDNDKDFHTYVRGHANKIPPRPSEITYEQHPTLASKTQQPSSRNVSSAAPPVLQPPVQQPSLSVNTSSSQPGSMNSRYSASQAAPGPLVAPSQSQTYNQPSYAQAPPVASPQQQTYLSYGQQQPVQSPAYSHQPPPARADTFTTPPYPTDPAERSASGSGSGYPPQQTGSGYPPQQTGSGYPPQQAGSGYPPQQAGSGYPPQQTGSGYPPQQTMGTSAVPSVVTQCINAVDHFGLDTTGIYRQSGTQSQVQRLISQFNHNPSSIDFRNPANFYHDVHIPATLLKQFFKQLPDPLFTHEAYQGFIDASKSDEESQRRDGLHALINELPDPNYATMRALVLHLHRVTLHESKNRMGSGNLGVCFAPSLMGTHTGSQIADAGLQARVLDTVLTNATAIFDED